MPPPKRTSSALGGDGGDDPQDAAAPTSSDDVLALAEEAEAEAAEAEALAAAARARARALRLRREAAAAAASAPTTVEPVPAAETSEAAESTEPAETAEHETNEHESDEAPADVAGAVDETTADEPADASPQRRIRLPRPSLALATAALAAALTVGFVAAGVYMTLHHQRVVAQQERSAEFAAAARQGVVTLMSLDFTRAEEDVQRIIDNTTGDFRKDFEGQAEIFTQVAQESKVITEATVNSVAVASMTQDTATVLVAVTTNVSNAASQEQQPRSWRLSVDVARDAGQIKLAKVEFVP
jgi:Mce-associated membrane protein